MTKVVRMAKGRKNASVKSVMKFVNFNLARTNLSNEAKMSIAILGEKVLHESGNYLGYRPLSDRKTDEYSREYYIASHL